MSFLLRYNKKWIFFILVKEKARKYEETDVEEDGE